MTRDLRTRLLHPDARSEVDAQLECRLARLRKQVGCEDGADADVDGQELIELDERRRRRLRVVEQVHARSLTAVPAAAYAGGRKRCHGAPRRSTRLAQLMAFSAPNYCPLTGRDCIIDASVRRNILKSLT